MRSLMPMFFLALGALLLNAQTIGLAGSREVRVEEKIDAPLAEVWRVFTTSRGAEEFFAEKANIGPQWDGAYVHFERGWSELLSRLEKRFTDGPINWSVQPMMYQEPKAHKL